MITRQRKNEIKKDRESFFIERSLMLVGGTTVTEGWFLLQEFLRSHSTLTLLG